MKNYIVTVKINETWLYIIEVEAMDKKEAKQQAKIEMFNKYKWQIREFKVVKVEVAI